MNQNTPNPRLALRLPQPCSLPIEWGSRGCPPNVNLRPWSFQSMGGTGHPRSGCRQGTEMGGAAILARGIMINSRGERRTKALEGTEDLPTDSEQHQAEKPEGTDCSHHQSSHAFSGIFTCGSGGPLATGVGLWLKLIPFIITFDLIYCNISLFMVKFKIAYLKNNILMKN